MPDEAIPAPEGDKPEVTPVAPEPGTSAPEPEYFSENFDPTTLPEALQPAYRQMQGAFTKKSQSNAEVRKQYEQDLAFVENLRTSPEAKEQFFRQLAVEHGYQLEDPDPEPMVATDDGEPPAWAAELLADKETRELASVASEMLDHIDQLAEGKKLELTVKQRDAIFREARDAGAHQASNGKMVTERVFDEWFDDLSAAEQKAVERYRKSKRAPRVPAPGQPGTAQVDLKDPKQRRAVMAAAIADAESE